jgi:aryl-alcohol dehydrogenase-like predicted oxidoreductase
MRKRRLGKQGLAVSEVGLGCMGMSEFYGPRDDQESVATIQRAIDAGLSLKEAKDFRAFVITGRCPAIA